MCPIFLYGVVMKYWNTLTELESNLIKLDTVVSMMRVMSNGVEDGAGPEDVRNCFWFMQEHLEKIVNDSNENFQQLWDQVRNDNWIEENKKDIQVEKETIKNLTEAVNSWVNE
jgi:hypothetical protein